MADKQTKIREAYEAVMAGAMSARAASQHFGVPRTTLRDKLSHKSPLDRVPKTALTHEEEAKFSQWAINMARAGFGRTRNDFTLKIQAYLSQLKEPQLRFKNENLPGKTWYCDYLKRHTELTERNARAFGFERAILTSSKVEGWFDALHNYILEKDATLLSEPARWFNCDEFRFALGMKDLYPTTSNTTTQITTLCCMSALGYFLPPMIVLAEKRLTVNPTQSFRECTIGMSASGGMTADLFVSWLEKVFIPGLDKEKVRRPVLLFLDESSMHKSLKASDICLRNGIILYCLQANATHLQPLDLAFFGSLKHHWAEAVMDYQLHHPGQSVTKSSFGLVFKTAYLKACKREVAKVGFEKAGLFPFNKEVVLNLKSNEMMASNIVAGPPKYSPQTPSAASLITPTQPFSLAHSPSPTPTPSWAERLLVLEGMMEEEVKVQFRTRFEEGYDLDDNPLYNMWKKCKVAASTTEAPGATTHPSTSSGSAVTPEVSVVVVEAASIGATGGPVDLDIFLYKSTPQVGEKKKRRREFLPNMVLTSPECFEFFEAKAEAEREKELKEEKRKEKREKIEDIEKEKKKENDKLRKRKGTGGKGKKGGKKKRTGSSSEKETGVRVVVDGEVGVGWHGWEVNENECAKCSGVYRDREASAWVGCNDCTRWYHKRCVTIIDLVGLDGETLKELEFVCDNCL